MADDADITAERDEREAGMRLAASRRDEGAKANGRCHWCDDPAPPLLRFCSSDCRDEHERIERLKRNTYR